MASKRILFDFLTFEDKYINGGALYVKTVLLNLLQKNCTIVGICKHISRINSEIMQIINEKNIRIYEGINEINNVVVKEKIDLFFIGITQRYNFYDLTSLDCQIIGICHDIGDIVMDEANISNREYRKEFKKIIKNRVTFKSILVNIYLKVKSIIGKAHINNKKSYNKLVLKYNYFNFAKLLKKKNFQLITVSNYSKNAIEYFFNGIANEIDVLYPCEAKRNEFQGQVNFKNLESKKFFVMLSCNRLNKNFINFYKSFIKFNEMNPDFYAVAIGLDRPNQNNIIYMKSVTDAELKWLIENCFALVYPSFNEGFGLPPLEAMKYSKPVLAAFDTSIPEVCGNAALYFNPQYPDDLYMKYKILIDNYEFYSKNGFKHYEYISNKRLLDNEKLMKIILNGIEHE